MGSASVRFLSIRKIHSNTIHERSEEGTMKITEGCFLINGMLDLHSALADLDLS
jgi:hypothetical protein